MKGNHRFTGPLLMLLLAAMVFVYPLKPAHAVTGIVQTGGTPWPGTCNTFCQAHPTYPNSVTSVTSGNTLVLVAHAIINVAGCSTPNPTSVVDTLGTSYTLVTSFCTATSMAGGYGQWAYIGIARATGLDTANVTMGASIPANDADLTIIEISGIPGSYTYKYSDNRLNSGSPVVTTDYIALPSTYFALSVIGLAENACSTPQGGFTVFTCYDGAADDSLSVGYGINPNITSPTNFPWTNVNGGNDLGVVWGQTGQVTTNLVVACTAYQLQCWLYPLFVFGVYMILVVGLAVKVQVPGRDMTGHLMEAFSLASLICVLLGVINIMVPLTVTVIQVVRFVRE